jgi:hypothetical protein
VVVEEGVVSVYKRTVRPWTRPFVIWQPWCICWLAAAAQKHYARPCTTRPSRARWPSFFTASGHHKQFVLVALPAI